MKIREYEILVMLEYYEYKVAAFRATSKGQPLNQCEPENAMLWCVMGVYGEGTENRLATFKFNDQDTAHQFAELLTTFLNQLKAFEYETIQTKEQSQSNA